MRSVIRTALAVATLALTLSSGASAATVTPQGWTISDASKAVMQGNIPGSYWTVGDLDSSAARMARIVWTGRSQIVHASCTGIGQQPSPLHFWAFTCAFSYKNLSDVSGTVIQEQAWVRLWPGASVCASTRALADCPPAPKTKVLPGDPRTAGAESGAAMSGQAETLTNDKMRSLGKVAWLSPECVAVSAFVYRCFGSGHVEDPMATVYFVNSGTSWSTVVDVAQ